MFGNDIVDLKDSREVGCRSRYRERVLHSSEYDFLTPVDLQRRKFWSFWAAKEAIYKALVRYKGPMPFIPNTIVVDFHSQVGFFGDLTFKLRWEHGEDWIHCLAVMSKYDDRHLLWRMRRSTVKRQSKEVRLLAGELLLLAGFDPHITLWRQTKKNSKGVALPESTQGVPISLSHDGRFVAAALFF